MSVPPPDHLSPTMWSLFEKCPAAWRWRYIEHVKDPPSFATETGKFAHKVLELLMGEDPPARTIPRARQIAAQVWADPGEVDLSVAPEVPFKHQAWSGVVGLWSIERPERVAVLATERRVRWELQGVTMEVVVDRVARNSAALLEVADYKSGAYRTDRQATPRRQVVLGALAVAYAFPDEGVGNIGKLLYTAAEKAVTVNTDDLMRTSVATAAEATWADIIDACKADDFPPTPGPLCGWCTHLAHCPEGLRQVERQRVNPNYRSPGLAVLAAHEAA